MKKFLFFMLAFLFIFFAAGAEETLPVFEWEHDGLDHWQLDETGAIVNRGAHECGDDMRCGVCGGEILDWGDGTYDVTDYDAYGNTLRYSSYDEAGQLTYHSVHALTCNEDGVVLKDVEYIDGVLYSETVYAVTEVGEQTQVSQISWNDDGTTSVNDYDEYGNCIRSAVLGEDGSVFHETVSEYALNSEGSYYECKITSRFDTGESCYEEINEYGDKICSIGTLEDGSLWSNWRYEYEYLEGIKVWSKQYSGDVLTLETHFDEEGRCVKEIEYLEEGGSIVYEYDVNGDLLSATTCAADGSTVSVKTYEYVYGENMEQLEVRVYVDGVLTEDTVYHYDEDMNFTGYCESVYHEDGTRTVVEYDDCMEYVRTVVYAADGSVISEETAESDADEGI